MSSTDKPTTRLAFIDALRGLAAISIVGYHLFRYEPTPKVSEAFLSALIEQWLRFGWVGVQILLVISGFVIAYSFRDGQATCLSVGNFLARRLVRLSPPYLVALVLVTTLHGIAVSGNWFPSPLDVAPTWEQFVSHVIYAQDIFGYPSLSAGLWTVCIELQFYVLFGFGLILAHQLRPINNSHETTEATMMAVVFAPLAIGSLCVWCSQAELAPWVIYFFAWFFLGMVTWWALADRVPRGWYWITVGAFAARLLWQWKPEVMLGLIASLTIYSVGRSGHLHDWLNFGWLQYLGKISYSLYLIHYAVCHVVSHVGWALMDGSPSPAQATGILVMAMACSIGVAHLLFEWVEAPSARLATRMKLRPATIVPPVQAVTSGELTNVLQVESQPDAGESASNVATSA